MWLAVQAWEQYIKSCVVVMNLFMHIITARPIVSLVMLQIKSGSIAVSLACFSG